MSAVNWFEIPVTDMGRASRFYETVLGADIAVQDMTESMGSVLGMLPDRGGVGGALVQNSAHGYTPSQQGVLVYLSVGDEDLNEAVERVAPAGGTVLLPKTSLGGNGFCAWMLDTEGNKVGLFSMK